MRWMKINSRMSRRARTP